MDFVSVPVRSLAAFTGREEASTTNRTEASGPYQQLGVRRRIRLDQDRVREERDHGTRVRESEQAVWKCAGKPGLQQGTGGGEQQIRQSDRDCEDTYDGDDRVIVSDQQLWLYRQQQETDDEQHAMNPPLHSSRQEAADQIRVKVADQQCRLEEHHRGDPDTC